MEINETIKELSTKKISRKAFLKMGLFAFIIVLFGKRVAASWIFFSPDQSTSFVILDNGEIKFNNTAGFIQQSTTGDGTTTIDWRLGNKFKFTFGAQNETFTFTSPTNPCNLMLILVQDATGSRTITFPASVKWSGGTAPTLTTTAEGVDIIALYYDGSSYHGVSSLDFS